MSEFYQPEAVMKHIATISGKREIVRKLDVYEAPVAADAKTDFYNALWRALSDSSIKPLYFSKAAILPFQ